MVRDLTAATVDCATVKLLMLMLVCEDTCGQSQDSESSSRLHCSLRVLIAERVKRPYRKECQDRERATGLKKSRQGEGRVCCSFESGTKLTTADVGFSGAYSSMSRVLPLRECAAAALINKPICRLQTMSLAMANNGSLLVTASSGVD